MWVIISLLLTIALIVSMGVQHEQRKQIKLLELLLNRKHWR